MRVKGSLSHLFLNGLTFFHVLCRQILGKYSLINQKKRDEF